MTARFGFRACSIVLGILFVLPGIASASCDDIARALNGGNLTPSLQSHLAPALKQATFPLGSNNTNGGFGLNMWATIVDRDGVVCAVAFTGNERGDQWPGSRVISAQKANTANAFSLPGLSLSTANLYTAVQPGGSLFGLQESNPVSTSVAYGGNAADYGTSSDPMKGGKIGGINVFGGGLSLYAATAGVWGPAGTLLGGIGVSGDSSCADHNIAWKTRAVLNLDNIPGGVAPASGTDNIVYDISQPGNSQAIAPKSASGWGHPQCSAAATAVGNGLPSTFPVGPAPLP